MDLPNTNTTPDPDEILARLELQKEHIQQIREYIETELAEVETNLESLTRSVLQVLNASKAQAITDRKEITPLQFIDDIEDERLRETLNLLLHYQGSEARAEDLARLQGKHRSTMSQYLNSLVSMEKVTKRRVGHEVYFSVSYTATMKAHEEKAKKKQKNDEKNGTYPAR